MNVHVTDYAQLDFLPHLIQDYLSGSNKLTGFYKYPFRFDSFRQIITDRSFSGINRKVLVETLNRQYQTISVCDKVIDNIRKLNDARTFTITTAHQPVLFTGPLYFIYKIISAINVAEQLNRRFPDNHFVPVYFMGAEDHDFDEINHCIVNGDKLEWQHDKRGAVGRMPTREIVPLIAELENRLKGEFAAEVIQKVKNAYDGNATLAKATAQFVHDLFGTYGLVVINPDDIELKKLFASAMEEELFNSRVKSISEKAISNLSVCGYEIQANPREINLFYLTESSRERIVFDEKDNRYRVLNTVRSFTKEEIADELRAFPERFSPNVFLRPLYQETILPNLAYIGGAGELSYWLEQKSIFDFYNINFPMLVLRNSAALVDASTQKKFEKTGLDWNTYFQEEDTIVKNYVKSKSDNLLDFAAEKDKINLLFNEIRNKAAAVDTTLAGAAEAQKTAALNSIDGLEKKMLKAEKRNFETITGQIKTVKGKLFPGNSLQERVENFLPYYAENGKLFFDTLLSEFDPFRKQMLIFFP